MDILDKLFSRELNRRTGEKAIKIDAAKKAATRKRARTIGKNAILNSTEKPAKKETKRYRLRDIFHRLNVRFPWLKLATVLIIGLIAIADLLDLTISKANDPYYKIRVAPMSKHVRATTRDLTGKKLIALTFDDGPSPITTPALLDKLKEKEVYATFFMLGTMARSHPDLVKRVKNEGHEVASHTMYHQNLPRISAAAVEADINESRDVFKNIIGKSPTLTRPPYGNTNDVVRRTVKSPIIIWSVDTLDWKNRDVGMIVDTTMNQARDGGIVLMHDIYNTTVDSVPFIIDKLRADGYEFVTVSELARYRNVKLSNGVSYYSFYP